MQSASILMSFQFAIRGFAYVIRTQRNAKIHCLFFAAVIVMSTFLKVPMAHLATLVLTCGFVIVAEIVNTAIETVVDLASPDHHELAGRAKDVAAGAVFCSALFAVAVGLILLGPPLYQLCFHPA